MSGKELTQKKWMDVIERTDRRKIAYISGAITGTTDYIARFAEAERRLTAAGYKVINPAKTSRSLEGALCYEDIMDVDLVLLQKADMVYMLRGWEKSRGANREYGYALGSGKEIRKEETQ